ncbi:MAG: methyl-accepting chemotaxis protein [Succinivibrio sp.]
MTISLVLTAFYSISNTRNITVDKIEALNVRNERTRNALNALYELNDIVRTIVVNPKADIDALVAKAEPLEKSLKECADALQMTRYPQEIGPIKESTKSYIKTFNEQLVIAAKREDKQLARNIVLGPMNADFLVICSNMPKVNGYQIRATKDAMSEIKSYGTFITIGMCTILEIVIAIIFTVVIPSNLRKSIKDISVSADRLSQGDLREKINTDRKDELKPLSDSLETMRLSWQENITEVITVSSNIGKVIDAISGASDKIQSTAEDNQNRAITVAAASDEMVSTTNDIAQNCEVASNTAEGSKDSTSSGVSQIQSMIDKIANQVGKSKDDAVLVQKLASQAEKIGTIVQTIDDIASQTNLLALNAAIEAARAGEAGKGFAVVADEVRALASRTSASTQEITRMVTQIQSDATIADQAMQESVSVMDDMSSQSEQIEKILSEVTDSVTEVSNQITHIATSAEQQTVATSEISTNMKSITDGSRNLKDAIASINSDIQSSTEQVQTLINIIAKFKV